MNKEELIEVFNNTKSMCETLFIPDAVSNKYSLSDFSEDFGSVRVESIDTVSALVKYAKTGKTLVLNMASSKRPGGGVANGAMAQEECLYRCSNLYTVSPSLYPIKKDEYIYSKDVTFIKDKDYNLMKEVKCDVITIAAVNFNKEHVDGPDSFDYDEYSYIMCQKMNAIFKSAREHGCVNIILGAWGCGVFKNDPVNVAHFFNHILFKYKNSFKNVIFAIINDQNSVKDNYTIFNELITQY